jgi:hypothetical protein
MYGPINQAFMDNFCHTNAFMGGTGFTPGSSCMRGAWGDDIQVQQIAHWP